MSDKQTVFISYSHKDALWKDRLVVFLQALGGDVEVWGDERIGAGMNWREEIEAAMDRASVAVLLVTANFLISTFIQNEEVPRLLKRQNTGTLQIMPIIVLPCPWGRHGWIANLQCRPKDGQPLALRKDESEKPETEVDRDLNTIVNEIARMTERTVQAAAAETTTPPPVAMPAPVPPTAVAQSAQDASAVVRTVTRSATRSSITTVLTRFEETFRSTSKAIEAITSLKAIHDELHTFELNAFTGIQTDYSRIGSDAEARERLSDYAGALQDTLHQVDAIAEHVPALPGGKAWVEKLRRAHALLIQAIQAREQTIAGTAVALLNTVLDGQPQLLNQQIVARSEALDFSPVQTALETAQGRLNAEQAPALEQREKVKLQIASLSHLGPQFIALVKEHDQWQQIEKELRTMEASIGGSLKPLETLWPILSDIALPVFADESRPGNAILQAACVALGQKLAAANVQQGAEVRNSFRDFRRRCERRFYQVDVELRDACERLIRLSDSMQLLLRMLDKT